MIYTIRNSGYLAHHGIKGQKWGIRRYQNEDGTLTAAGKKRRAQYMKFIKSEQPEIDNGVVSKNNARNFFNSEVGQQFINDPEIKRIYEERNKSLDESHTQDADLAALRKYYDGIKSYVNDIFKDYGDKKVWDVDYEQRFYNKSSPMTPKSFVMQVIEEADWAYDENTRAPYHKYFHHKAWQWWS